MCTRASRAVSLSRKGQPIAAATSRPTVVLPAPIWPMITTCRHVSCVACRSRCSGGCRSVTRSPDCRAFSPCNCTRACPCPLMRLLSVLRTTRGGGECPEVRWSPIRRVAVEPGIGAAPSAGPPVGPIARGCQSVRARRGRGVHRGAVVVLLVGALVTLALSLGAGALNSRNEDRLLHQRAREVGLVAASSTSATQTPLSSAASVAEATNGDIDAFKTVMGPLAGAGKRFGSASLWSLDATPPRVIAVVGTQPSLASEAPSAISEFFAKANSTTLAINDELGTARRLGYAVTASGVHSHYAVYTETELPKDRKANIAKDSAFGDLGYALYVGREADRRTAPRLEHRARHIRSQRIDDGAIRQLFDPDRDPGRQTARADRCCCGCRGFSLRSVWCSWHRRHCSPSISSVGAKAQSRLPARSTSSARENERLYNEQRSVARTLQHTLLPGALPDVGPRTRRALCGGRGRRGDRG